VIVAVSAEAEIRPRTDRNLFISPIDPRREHCIHPGSAGKMRILVGRMRGYLLVPRYEHLGMGEIQPETKLRLLLRLDNIQPTLDGPAVVGR
jgi:hypothetical protein